MQVLHFSTLRFLKAHTVASAPVADICLNVAAIFDGHGGHSAAEYMSQNLYEILSVSIDDETHDTECQIESKLFAACSRSVLSLAAHSRMLNVSHQS